jgi:polyvinyl alcohol dehydrogenase (cytochrome)
MRRIVRALIVIAAGALLLGDDWPTYQHDPQRSGASGDSILSPTNANNLVKLWTFHTGRPIAASASVVGNTVYVGSWDGFEYALDARTGTLKWKTDLGISKGTTGDCGPMGVSAAAAVVGKTLYVGGGKPFWYALSATTGRVLWRVKTGDELSNGRYYSWASPLIDQGNAYIGIASHCDEPLVPGALWEVSLRTHRVIHRLAIVPRGELGGAVWTSPAVDPATGTITISTGNEGQEPATSQPYARAILALSPSLRVRGVWQLPDAQVLSEDSDWSGTPTLFTTSKGKRLLAVVNKNGYVYAFDRARVGQGPVWRSQIAGPDLNVSSTAFGNGLLYAAGSKGSWQGTAYNGSVRALNPVTGAVVWFVAVTQSIWPALTYANGLVFDGAGRRIQVRDASNGRLRFQFQTGGRIYAPASVSGGRIFAGSSDGNLYAFGLVPPAPTATPTPTTTVTRARE